MSRKAIRNAQPQDRWASGLFKDPVAFGTMLAALAALITTFISYRATHDAIETSKLDNAPALYLACILKSRPSADIYYPIADVSDYPGAYNDTDVPVAACSLTNISRRPLVNIRLGILAMFYDRASHGPERVRPFGEQLVFPDDGGGAEPVIANRSQTINLAPGSKILLVLPNASYHYLFLDPAERAEAQYPGDDSVQCADVYIAPGTLRELEQAPMPKLPANAPRSPAGSIPPPPTSECINFSALVTAQAHENPWAPSVFLQFKLDKHHRHTPLLQLPHE
jgi:hypothetical protein